MPIIRFDTKAGPGWVEFSDEAYGKPLTLVDAEGNAVGSAEFKRGRSKAEPKEPGAPDLSKPGLVLKWLIQRKIGRRLQCSECREWVNQMNEWGWWGCLITHRKEIEQRLREQAEKHGFEFRGVWRELVSRAPKEVEGTKDGP